MADIDVTELLADADFVDPISIVHQAATVNTLGENVVTENSVDTYGSVQPASGRAIQRLPDALRVANISSFWVRGTIRASLANNCQYPDILVFRNKRYQVQTVMDFTNWGSGWSEGTCVAEKLTG